MSAAAPTTALPTGAEVNMVQATPHRNYQTIKPQRVLIILMAMTQRRLQMVQGTSSPSGPRASQGLEAWDVYFAKF
jgi:hypothetical protein